MKKPQTINTLAKTLDKFRGVSGSKGYASAGLRLSNGVLRLAVTCGHHLYAMHIPCPPELAIDAIIDSPAYEAMVKGDEVLVEDNGRVTVEGLEVNPDNATFPPIDRVLARRSKCGVQARVDRDKLLVACRQAKIMTHTRNRSSAWTLGSNAVLIETRNPEEGEAAVTIPADVVGHLYIGVDIAYVMQYLRTVPPGATVRVDASNADSAMYFSHGTDDVWVVLPMRL